MTLRLSVNNNVTCKVDYSHYNNKLYYYTLGSDLCQIYQIGEDQLFLFQHNNYFKFLHVKKITACVVIILVVYTKIVACHNLVNFEISFAVFMPNNPTIHAMCSTYYCYHYYYCLENKAGKV